MKTKPRPELLYKMAVCQERLPVGHDFDAVHLMLINALRQVFDFNLEGK